MNVPSTTGVRVDLGPRSYDIAIRGGILGDAPRLIREWRDRRFGTPTQPPQCCLVTDAHVESLYARGVAAALAQAGCESELVVLPPGEESKQLDVIAGIYDRLVAIQADRQTIVIAIGGGVVGDAAGFAAATYARGIPFVQVPTTLLAQVDSSVGGKVGVNHAAGKNLIGAFHQPLGVVIDTNTLQSLPERDYRSGLAEVVKYGVILDAGFFAFLESHVDGLNNRAPDVLDAVVTRCCRLKADVVERDEQERTGLRAVLNYGHTFAHAFEALAGYGELLHGEAVSLGMESAARLADRLQRVDRGFCERQRAILKAVGLPTVLPEERRWEPRLVLERMRLDKKSTAGGLRFVLPTQMGHVELVDDVPESAVLAVLT
ncbi:MAG: 3-dehydroquinate synthase [Planctomycetaceae bacterium]